MQRWIVFIALIVILLILDLFFFHKKGKVLGIKEAALMSGLGILFALLFGGYVYVIMGQEAGINFLTGYLIEKTLSVDNLFVFLLIFHYFQTPPPQMQPVLFWGILGAIFFRVLFILVGLAAVNHFHIIIYIFGLFLILIGLKWLFQKKPEVHPEKNFIIRMIRSFLPMTPHYVNDHFWVIQKGRFLITPLFLVLIAIESSDILFAIDSIPAIFAITYDPFLVITSNIFAVLGLRALFFLLANFLVLFHFLQYGISAILIFVGLKMVASDWIKLSPLISLSIVLLILFLTILASILIKKKERKKEK